MSRAWCHAATILALICLCAPGASAQNATQPRLLTVSGEGQAKAKPDRATLSAGVVAEAKTAAAALAANSRAMNAVFDTLHRFGIPERAIQTSQLSVQPQYPNDSRQPRRVVGYEVTNTVTVTLDDLDKVGPAVDALVSSGANSLGDIGFSIRDPKPLQTQAREAAVKDAIGKAETLARAAGVTLGPVFSLTDGWTSQPITLGRRVPMDTLAASTPVAAGEETVTANVTISWEIR